MRSLLRCLFACTVFSSAFLHGDGDWAAIPCVTGEMGARGAGRDGCCYADISAIYWKTGGDELDYGVVRYEYVNSTLSAYKQRYHDMKMDWDWGFQLGAGCPIPCLDWNLDLEWTHYKTDSFSSATDSADPNATQTTFAIPFIVGSELDLASGSTGTGTFKGHYSVRYDVIDLELGRWFGRKNCLFGFRPHAGLRIANIREGMRSSVATTLASNPFYKAHVKNDFVGIGLRAGIDTELAVYEGVSIIGRASGAIVWGRTKINLKADEISNSSQFNSAKATSKEDYLQGRAMADFALGLRWSTQFCNFPFTLGLDWELRYLFGQHRFFTNNAFAEFGGDYPTLQTKKNGDLTLQGVTLNLATDF